jgi:hypothetical protein
MLVITLVNFSKRLWGFGYMYVIYRRPARGLRFREYGNMMITSGRYTTSVVKTRIGVTTGDVLVLVIPSVQCIPPNAVLKFCRRPAEIRSFGFAFEITPSSEAGLATGTIENRKWL